MSIAALKTEIADLPLKDRRELLVYIASLNRKNNEEFLRKLGEKLDDPSHERWLSLEEVERRFEN